MNETYTLQYRLFKSRPWRTCTISANSLGWFKNKLRIMRSVWPKYEWRICKVVETLEEIEVIK